MVDFYTRETIILNIVSIIIAALIVRIIYAWFDVTIIAIEQAYDEKYRDGYGKTIISLGNAILITGICGIMMIFIYQWWIHYGMHYNKTSQLITKSKK